jgi:hypothetical protein
MAVEENFVIAQISKYHSLMRRNFEKSLAPLPAVVTVL